MSFPPNAKQVIEDGSPGRIPLQETLGGRAAIARYLRAIARGVGRRRRLIRG
jgi:hypothetical protein